MNALLRSVGAITLLAEDLERSRQFYEDAFGLRMIFEDENSAVYDFGNTMINLLRTSAAGDLIEPGTVARGDAGSRLVLSIWVDDVDGVCAELGARGVALLSGPVDRPWGKRTASFADPDGNIWEVAQDIPRPDGA